MGIKHNIMEFQKSRPKCKSCDGLAGIRPGKSKLGFIRYKTYCATCDKRGYKKFKKEICEFCGFIPVHRCQLDVDHKDGNNKNNKADNLQTLCANCHRLKTQLNKEYLKKNR